MSDKTLYFAYGSNINLHQMSVRCPNAQVVGPVTLENYELLFRGGSSGYATIAPSEGSRVHGLLWEITPRCQRNLDFYEGYPGFYEKQTLPVVDSQGQEVQVMAYVMTEPWARNPIPPSNSYYKGIEEGYRDNGLPVSELKKAWEHVVQEIHTQTREINRHAGRELSKPQNKKRGGHGHER